MKRLILSLFIGTLVLALMPVFSSGTAMGADEWYISYDVKYQKSNNRYTLDNVKVDFGDKKAGSLYLQYPDTVKPGQDVKIPDGWIEVEKGKAYSIPDRATAAQVKDFIEDLYFVPARVNSRETIRVSVGEDNIAAVAYKNHADGKTHYYTFVPFRKDENRTFEEAYEGAGKQTFNGMHGYLATLTSKDEDDFVYDSISTKPGYLGGMRLVKADGTRPALGGKTIETDDLIFDTQKGRQWYWVSGPEAGQVFCEQPVRTAARNEHAPENTKLYSNWSKTSDVAEPNNSEYEQSTANVKKGEGVLQFAYEDSRYWNDIGLYGCYWNDVYRPGSADSGKPVVDGYYVEFSEYGGEKETDKIHAAQKSRSLAYAYEVAHIKEADYDFHDGNVTLEKLAQLTNVQMKGIAGEDMELESDIKGLEALNSAIRKQKKRTFTVVYTTAAGETFYVAVHVNGKTKGTISAAYSTIEAGSGALNEKDIIKKAGITVADADGHPVDADNISLDKEQLQKLNAAIREGKAGDYKLTIKGPDGAVYDLTVKVSGKGSADGGNDNVNNVSNGEKATTGSRDKVTNLRDSESGAQRTARTGDDTDIAPMLIVMIAAGIGAAVAGIRRRGSR
ncbi:MAG: hypothetical protein ACOX4I_07660 [Anaerovoracaceae bacterium]|jgi:hypothetical protein